MLLGRRCGRVTDVLVSLAGRPPGRADLAKGRAITLQAGSHKGGLGTRSGPLLAIAAGQATVTDFAEPLGGALMTCEDGRCSDMYTQVRALFGAPGRTRTCGQVLRSCFGLSAVLTCGFAP